MLPPSPWYSQSRLPLRCQILVHNITSCNILCDCVLAVVDIHPDLIQTHRCQCRPKGWVHQCPTPLTFGAHDHHPPYQLVVETLKGLLHPGGNFPCLWPKQKHHLHHHHIKSPLRSPIRSLPPQKVSTIVPTLPRLPEVLFHCWLIFVRGQQHSSQVIEQRNFHQRCPILQ